VKTEESLFTPGVLSIIFIRSISNTFFATTTINKISINCISIDGIAAGKYVGETCVLESRGEMTLAALIAE